MPTEIVAVLPPLIAIILAWITNQIIPALLLGLLAGSYIISPGIISGIAKMVEYIETTLLDQGNLDVLLFLYVFSGFVGLLKMSGGIEGFARLLDKRTKTKKGTLLAMWAIVPITFLDCAYRVVATGSIFKPLTDKQGVSRERLAYMLNNSASPVVIMIPIATTFVGFLVGTVGSGLKAAGLESSPYITFLRSIPFNFFSITSIIIALGSILFNLNFAAMGALEDEGKEVERNQHLRPALDMEAGTMEKVMKQDDNNQAGKAYNLIIPILSLLFLSVYLMWWTGQDERSTFWQAIMNAEASRSMFLALVITTGISAIMYLSQGFSLKELTESFFEQGNQIIHTIAILAVAWPIADITNDLGLSELITSTLGDSLPNTLVPIIIFLVASLVSYFIGSSWGTFALLMPIAIPLAAITNAAIPITIGAVFAGGTFGDVTSPLSGMTVMAADAAEAKHMEYVKAQLPYNLFAFGLAAILFTVAPLII
ncbi:Na+/H+ antiporter NhaC [Candidatus Frackibacter sp. WG11]|uniref:Na+/H+ antiporter NhaC family protein n=1 Tax=Candidatus Frackibacter sp. WG11 TaxID=2017976 RepID=UPI00088A6142|nr:Na+/H+ antiporter NhaC family protein [Candidatus Frackibacter sp. WG11]SDC36558.1 Na+/H+ antiporter NhaC [Candidatus Frackibacter sp. WG11]